jgi:basic amino acid/polyamine antiporter, APA family
LGAPARGTLARTLGRRDLILIVVGTVIGSGIFTVPGAVLRQTQGDVGVALLVWTLGGGLSLIGALCYGELGAMLPEAGGGYVYIREAFGRLPAFLLGWTLFLVVGTGSIATLAVAFGNYLGQLVPITPLQGKIAAVVMIAVVAAVNIKGTRDSARVQGWSTGIKVAAILVVATAGLVLGHGLPAARARSFTTPADLQMLLGIGYATIGVLWAYEGWSNAAANAGEVIDPQRNFAWGMGTGTAALIAIYVFANVGYLAALGPGVAATDTVTADAVRELFGPAAARLVAAAILVSMFSATNGLILTTSRVYYAMAGDGLFFRRLAEVHPRFGTPALAIAAGSVWAMLLAITGKFEDLFTYVIFAAWIFYALGVAAVPVLRARRPDAVRPYRVPGYPVTPWLFVIAAGAIVVSTIYARPGRSGMGLGIILLGLPAYFWWTRRASPKTQ